VPDDAFALAGWRGLPGRTFLSWPRWLPSAPTELIEIEDIKAARREALRHTLP
jgi:hypothetical protein